MSLSKQQMIGAVGGGVFVVGALGLGWLLYSAWAGKGEAEEELTAQTEAYARFNNAAVYPSKASIESVKSNATSFAQWYDAAMAVAAQGDKVLPSETPPIFKQRLQGEVRRMLDLEGGVNGKIADSKFLFGFEQFLGEGGVLPKEEEVPLLAVQLDTIASLVDIFAEAGVHEVKSIVRVSDKDEKSAEGEERPSTRKSAKKGAAEEKGPKTTKQTYTFGLAARPEAIVETLNRLTSCKRFVVVRNFSLKSEDTVVERLNAAEKAKAEEGKPKTGSSRSRGRNRGAQVAVEAAPGLQSAVDRIVSDPEIDDPLTIGFTVDVYDFGRGVPAAEAAKPAEADKPAEAPAAEAKAEKQQSAEKPAAEKKENKQ